MMKKLLSTILVSFMVMGIAAAQTLDLFGAERPNRNNLRYVTFEVAQKGVNDNVAKDTVSPATNYTIKLGNDGSENANSRLISMSGWWKTGWFVSASIGDAVFVGKPVGCGDFYDRQSLSLSLNVGKWLVPGIGLRANYMGTSFKGSSLDSYAYSSFFGDFMLDLATLSFHGDLPKTVGVIPYIGTGILLNHDLDEHCFGLHYGVQTNININDYFGVNVELGCQTTFQSFDGVQNRDALGDHFLNLNVGVTYNLGDIWRYRGTKRHSPEGNTKRTDEWVELSYRDYVDTTYNEVVVVSDYAFNDYDGLNSLRRRMKGGEGIDYSKALGNRVLSSPDSLLLGVNGTASLLFGNSSDGNNNVNLFSDATTAGDIKRDLLGKKKFLLHFKLNSRYFDGEHNNVILEQAAAAIKGNSMVVILTGAADSATGDEWWNLYLSQRRAEWVKDCLVRKGVEPERILCKAMGGIAMYEENKLNRFVQIELSEE